MSKSFSFGVAINVDYHNGDNQLVVLSKGSINPVEWLNTLRNDVTVKTANMRPATKEEWLLQFQNNQALLSMFASLQNENDDALKDLEKIYDNS
jgi:hypothetical protein